MAERVPPSKVGRHGECLNFAAVDGGVVESPTVRLPGNDFPRHRVVGVTTHCDAGGSGEWNPSPGIAQARLKP